MASSIQVVVRLRPMNENEMKHSTLPVIKASTSDRTVTVIKGQGARQARSSFTFDNVFTAFSNQEEVFEATLKPVIRCVIRSVLMYRMAMAMAMAMACNSFSFHRF